MRNIDRVKEFHETFACFVNDEFRLDNFDRGMVLQRFNLITEETHELIEAVWNNDRVGVLDALTDLEYVIDGTYLTFGVDYPTPEEIFDVDYVQDMVAGSEDLFGDYALEMCITALCFVMVKEYKNQNIEELKEALFAMRCVLNTMFEVYGFEGVREAAAIEVHRSNMSKLSESGRPIYRESDGKVMKGPNYSKPNLQQFVKTDEANDAGAS